MTNDKEFTFMQDVPKSKQVTSIFSGMIVHRSIPLDRGSRERSEQLHLFPEFTCLICVHNLLYVMVVFILSYTCWLAFYVLFHILFNWFEPFFANGNLDTKLPTDGHMGGSGGSKGRPNLAQTSGPQ